MTLLNLIVHTTKDAVKIMEISFRTFFTCKITTIFNDAEQKYIAEKVFSWMEESEKILQEFDLVMSDHGLLVDEHVHPGMGELRIRMRHVYRMAVTFEQRFSVICLRRASDNKISEDVEGLFRPQNQLDL